jgi:hypothetical protein
MVRCKEKRMKQRNAMIAVWLAMFVALGLTLGFALQDSGFSAAEDPKSELEPGEGQLVAIRPDAVEVRLFVEGFPLRETPRTLELMDKTEGVPLTKAQRAILDRSLTRYRLRPSESDATPACYDPHHFFRYFNSKGEQVAEFQVCYCCRQVRVHASDQNAREGEVWRFDFAGVAAMLKDMDVPTDIGCRERG